MMTSPVPEPFGALLQSTLTHNRSSFSIVPCVEVNTTHGTFVDRVNTNGVCPRLNTSTYRRCRLYTSNSGRTGSPEDPGQAEVDPSTATPKAAGPGI